MAAAHSVNAIASQLNSVLQKAIRDQRTYVETMGEQTIRNGNVGGFVDLPTAGEIVAHVAFPIPFLEKPIFAPGLEVAANIALIDGDFPIWSATIGNWDIQNAADTILYVGATIGIFIMGASRSILHYSFQGRSFTAPTGTETTIASPL